MIERFGIDAAETRPEPRYNIAPSQMVSAVIEEDGARKLVEMRWGLIPHWAKDSKIGNKMINARAESLLSKGIYKPALQQRRCLVLADGFYEWKKIGKVKQPMYVRMKSKEPFAFAGLYEKWKSPSDKLVQSCAIITTSPNDLMRHIHDRMPVILDRESESSWLSPELTDFDELLKMLKPYPDSTMESYEISKYVNSPSNTGSECIRPLRQDKIST